MEKISELNIERLRIADLELHPLNARQGDIGSLCQSLEAHGQYKPIVVQRSRMRICAGNHTTQAAQILGWTQIAAVVLDIDDDQALRILIQDNRASDLATYDNAILTDALEHLARSDFGLEGTGFDGSDLDDLIHEFEPELPDMTPDKSEIPHHTREGDVWVLGPHRLEAGVARLHDVDILCNAFEGRTGLKPVLESTGEEVSFVE